MSVAFPGAQVPFVQGDRTVTPIWLLWLRQFVSQPGPIVPVSLGPSPASFTASGAGSLVLSGGTVSSITLTRSSTVAHLGSGPVPMVNNDVATITYSVAPAASFIPG